MKQVKLSVPTMKSNHCQHLVKSMLDGHKGYKVLEIKPGEVHLGIPKDTTFNEVSRLIENAGYPVEQEIQGALQQGEEFTFKTNIHCNSCVGKIGPVLDEIKEIHQWKVDITNPDKTLKVTGNNLDAEQLRQTIRDSGYSIELLNIEK